MAGIFGLLLSGAVRVVDQFYEYVTLLLPGNGTNGAQNNTFLDGSTNNFTITRNGNTTQGTFSPFSQTGWGNYFNGSSQLTAPSTNGPIQFGTSAFTIEFWLFPPNVSSRQSIFATTSGTGTGPVCAISGASAGAFGVGIYGSADTLSAGTGSLVANRWNHVAIVRASTATNDSFIYVDGVLKGTGTISTNFSTAYAISIGQNGQNAEYYTGYISNLRVVKGVAVYTGAFTPPTSPLTATQSAGTNIAAITTGQTTLLTCQSNRFIDNGQGNTGNTSFTITVNGSPTVVAFSPFNPTASWSAATYGGSGYFDGSGDYLTAPDNTAFNLTSGDFTLEAWVYWQGSLTEYIISKDGKSGVSYNQYVLYVGNGALNAAVGSGNNTSYGQFLVDPAAFPTNTWTHVAFVKNGSQLTLYKNGTSVATAAQTGTMVSGGRSLYIGYEDSQPSTSVWTGYISNARIVKGTAVYTGNFTPPSLLPITNDGSTSAAAYPSTANVNTSFASSATSLLLNFTNAGIYDATSKNDLETVGNAQISTTQSKFGGSSMYFDGTGDYLDIPPSTLLDLGSGDWTFEGWVYPASLPAGGSTSAIVTLANPIVGGFAALRLRLNSSGTLELYISTNGSSWAAFGTTSAGISAGQWSYIAVVRSGSGANNVQVYVNGTSRLSLSLSGTPYVGGKYVVGCTFSASAATEFWNGYMQDLRLTKGYARTITTPTAAFPTL